MKMIKHRNTSASLFQLLFFCPLFGSINAQTTGNVKFKTASSDQSLKITGEIQGLKENETVILNKFFYPYGPTSWRAVDTGFVKNGRFSLQDYLTDGPRLFQLNFPAHNRAATVILGNEVVNVSSKWKIDDMPEDVISMYLRFDGSHQANDFFYTRALKSMWIKSISEINRDIRKYRDSTTLSKNSLEHICGLMEAKNSITSSVMNIFLEHNYYGKRDAAVCEIFTEGDFYELKFDSTWLDIYKQLDEETKKSYYGKILQEYLPLMKSQPAPNFQFTTSDGRVKYIQEVAKTNKLTLLYFWSFDVRSDTRYPVNNELAQIYKKYHSKGFEIVNVSLDANQQKWKKIIVEENVPGYHTNDFKEEEGEAAMLYKIRKKDLYTILIDKNGKIVSWEVYGPEFMAYLYKTFGE
jgi:hypothetical protein